MSNRYSWNEGDAHYLYERLALPTALVTIDVQHMFVSDGGWFHRLGFDVSPLQAIVPGVTKLQRAARNNGLHQVHICSVSDRWLNWPRHIVAPRLIRRLDGANPTGDPPLEAPGAFLSAVSPEPEDAVVTKHSHDAFCGTPLDYVLKRMGSQTLLIAGVTTRCCVEATARSAFAHGYGVVVVEDAVADCNEDDHEAALSFIAENIGIVAPLSAVIEAAGWSEAP